MNELLGPKDRVRIEDGAIFYSWSNYAHFTSSRRKINFYILRITKLNNLTF